MRLRRYAAAKISCIVISVLVLVIPLLLLPGCNSSCSTDVHFAQIERPSAVGVFLCNNPKKADNLNKFQRGFSIDSEDIINGYRHDSGDIIRMIDPCVDSEVSPHIHGAALYIDHFNQYSYYKFPGWQYMDYIMFLVVLEFTFPEATGSHPSSISYTVAPEFICDYNLIEGEGPRELPGLLGIEYGVLEDPLGIYDMELGFEALRGAIFLQLDTDRLISVEGSGRLHDDLEWNGTMSVSPDMEAKLYASVAITTSVERKGDRIIIGGVDARDYLPSTIHSPYKCTFDFGDDSYYTMKQLFNE